MYIIEPRERHTHKMMKMKRNTSVHRWNSSISLYSKDGQVEQAFSLYKHMQEVGGKPDRITFICMLKCCCKCKNAFEKGSLIFNEIMKSSIDIDTSLGNALISMYAKCGLLEDARIVFDKMPNYDIVSWGAIIDATIRCGFFLFAFVLFEKMQNEGIQANHVLFLSIIRACCSARDINRAKILHTQIIYTLCESNMAIKNTLINMYCKCGNLEEAYKLFLSLESRDVITYSTLVGGLMDHHDYRASLELVWEMLENGLRPNRFVYLCAIKASIQEEDVVRGRYINTEIFGDGLEYDVFVRTYLVSLYAKCGNLEDARAVFDMFPVNDVVLWGVMIEEYVKHDHGLNALELYEKMQQTNVEPNKVVFLSLLKACGNTYAMYEGKYMHDLIIRNELESDIVIGSSIVDIYAKCGHLTEACNIFDRLPIKNVVTWAAIIMGHVQHGSASLSVELFTKMQKERVKPDSVIFLSILKACASMQDIVLCRLIHEIIIEAEFEKETDISNYLIDTYAKCGSHDESTTLFRKIREPDVGTWGALIGGYVEHGHTLHALEMFEEMQCGFVQPNNMLYSCILTTCTNEGAILQGRVIHAQIIRDEFESDVIIGTALIDMYAKYGSVEEARNVFHRLKDRNVTSWSVLINGFAKHGYLKDVLDYLQQMQEDGIEINKVIALGLLRACKGFLQDQEGSLILDIIRKSGMDSDVHIGSTLVDMYGKNGMLEEAHGAFDEILHKDSIAYGTLISGYVLHEHAYTALELFQKMKDKYLLPDKVTLIRILKACSSVGAVRQGQLIHEDIIKTGLETDAMVGNALLDMYANCMTAEETHKVLDSMLERDIFSWSSVISAYARSGEPELVRKCLEDMQKDKLVLDCVIFTNVLTACTQAGLFLDGCRYFNSMRTEYDISPTTDHYNCLVDMLSRVGKLDEAYDLLQTMPMIPDIISWRCLLNSCKMSANVDLGKHCLVQIAKFDSLNAEELCEEIGKLNDVD